MALLSTIYQFSSFCDITPDLLLSFIEDVGHEGFNSIEDAYEDLCDKLIEWKKLPKTFTIYRVVGVCNPEEIKKPYGEHWTLYKDFIDGDFLLSIGIDVWEDDVIPYVIEAQVSINDVDILQTIIQNLNYPQENEINVLNKGINIQISNCYPLDGYSN